MKTFGSQIIAEFIECASPLLQHKKDIEQLLSTGIERYGLELKSLSSYQFEPTGVTAIAIIGASHVAVHTYPEAGHLSLDIFTCAPGAPGPKQLMNFLKEALKPKYVRHKTLTRGKSIHVSSKDYLTEVTPNGFNIRYQVDHEYYNQRTDYQHLIILQNNTFGKMMFLDNELQIAESDADKYTQALTQVIVETKALEKVLILGGGDGGVLNHLLKAGAEHVTLVDIDAEVIAQTKIHFRAICENAFSDPRATLIIDEASTYLKHQKEFDSIVYDLTLAPEAVAKYQETPYFENLFDKIKTALKPGGLITLRVGSAFNQKARQQTEKLLTTRFSNIVFQEVYIPSFCDSLVFAQAQAPLAK